MLTSISASLGLKITTSDVRGAYLNARLPESTIIYMRISPECTRALCSIDPSYERFVNEKGVVYVRLYGALYGLLESGKLWQKLMTKSLISLGFEPCSYDKCVFRRGNGDDLIPIGLYVDDSMICTQNEKVREEVLLSLEREYGKLSQGSESYRGLQFENNDKGGVRVHQRRYIDKLLIDEQTKGTVSTPTAGNFLEEVEGSPMLNDDEKQKFVVTVARLNWLSTQTRPDLRFCISYLSSRAGRPNQADQRKLKRALKYLNGTRTLGLSYTNEPIVLRACIDASHLTHADRKGHSGIYLSLGNGFFTSRSKKQKLHCQSSAESELYSLNTGLNIILWARNLLTEMGYDCGTTVVEQDNQSSIKLAEAGKPTARTIHLEMRQFRVTEYVLNKTIRLEYVQSSEMVADILTKSVDAATFRRLRDRMHNEIGEDTKQVKSRVLGMTRLAGDESKGANARDHNSKSDMTGSWEQDLGTGLTELSG
jgi:hypothetical protein